MTGPFLGLRNFGEARQEISAASAFGTSPSGLLTWEDGQQVACAAAMDPLHFVVQHDSSAAPKRSAWAR